MGPDVVRSAAEKGVGISRVTRLSAGGVLFHLNYREPYLHCEVLADLIAMFDGSDRETIGADAMRGLSQSTAVWARGRFDLSLVSVCDQKNARTMTDDGDLLMAELPTSNERYGFTSRRLSSFSTLSNEIGIDGFGMIFDRRSDFLHIFDGWHWRENSTLKSKAGKTQCV